MSQNIPVLPDSRETIQVQLFLKVERWAAFRIPVNRGVYPYLPMATNAPWSIFLWVGGSINSLILSFNIQKCEFFVHKFNNLKSSYNFLTNFLARCARSIAFYPPLRNENMQCALPTPFIFFSFLRGHYPWLTASKIHWKHAQIVQTLIAYTMSKNCLRVAEKGRDGKTWEWGEERHGCWGNRRPCL